MNQAKMNAKNKTTIAGAAAAAAFGLAILVAGGNIGLAMAASSSERYNVGHHEGALMASIDEQSGYYNISCDRYTPGSHTDSYCSGYSAGYDTNWHIFKGRHIVLSTNVEAKQTQKSEQSAQINCFLAICGKNSIGQRSSQGQSIDTNTASNTGN